MTTIVLDADMREFFRERLVAALSRRRVEVEEATEFYLVNLLAGYASRSPRETLSRPLFHRLAEAVETPDAPERFRRFRELGDCALYVCGFFSEHLDRRGISRDYVVTMGHRAYGEAGDLCGRACRAAEARLREVYPELAEGFDDFARVLDDVRETTALRTPQDIVRLYERWRRTRSPLLASRLKQQGVFPQVADDGEVLH